MKVTKRGQWGTSPSVPFFVFAANVCSLQIDVEIKTYDYAERGFKQFSNGS